MAHLAPYVQHDSISEDFSVSDGVINALNKKDIVYLGASMGSESEFPFNLQPWVKAALDQDPELRKEIMNAAQSRPRERKW